MKKPKVIVFKKIHESVLEYIREHCELTYFESLDARTRPAFLDELRDAEGILGSSLKVDGDLLEQAPCLRMVSNYGVGYDSLDIPELARRGIMASNTPEVLNDSVADAIFGLLLATARRIPELDRMVKTGQWKGSVDERLFGMDVHHKTLGIIGMGGIGEKIAQRAHFGFDMKILYHNRSRKAALEDKYSAQYLSLNELLIQSDFVCLMTPLTAETKGLMGKHEFELMKPSAIFINGSRGGTVDEQALVEALRSRTIRAAGLDVFQQEPVPSDHPLLAMDNVVTLPHIASATHDTRLAMAWMAARNLVAGVQGTTPPNLIQP
jgi:glyoxylate/hydroxypyruvate/2-ketogluconate reductase